jgi:outer membrane murein-binding lipoprotein Lpp
MASFIRTTTVLALTMVLLAPACVAVADEMTITRTIASSEVSDTKRETDAIKSKLESAESRVRELISKLDTFSNDASAAKAEIHASLLDTWANVELLARDRCGSELESIRISQRKAEARAAELQDELRAVELQTEELKVSLAKSGNNEVAFKFELSAERSRRESVEAEVHELRDKLHWASATSNETRAYDLVSERLESLLLVVSERSQILQRVIQMVTDHHAGYEDWRKEIDTLAHLVRDADRSFSGDFQSAASEALQRRVSDLERRLKDSQRARDDAISDRNAIRKSYDKLRATKSMVTSGIGHERIVYERRDGMSFVGVFTACVMTLLCGAVLLLFCGWGSRGGGAAALENSGSGSAVKAPSDYQQSPAHNFSPRAGLQSSPMTYVTGGGSGQRNGSTTPRRY